MKFQTAITMVLLATSIMSNTIAPAHADCGELGQDPCTGAVPTVDQVEGIMQQLTDPNIPAANKGNIVTPGFSPDEAATVDDHLHRMERDLPPVFVIADIRPAPGNLAGATISTVGGIRRTTPPGPIVLIDQGGRWLITHDTAMTALDAFWYNANRHAIAVNPR